jgi:hypothetical protein
VSLEIAYASILAYVNYLTLIIPMSFDGMVCIAFFSSIVVRSEVVGFVLIGVKCVQIKTFRGLGLSFAIAIKESAVIHTQKPLPTAAVSQAAEPGQRHVHVPISEEKFPNITKIPDSRSYL